MVRVHSFALKQFFLYLAFLILGLVANLRATGISGLTISPSCIPATTATNITVSFTALINQWQSGGYAIAVSTDTTPSSGDTWYSSDMNGSCPGNGYATGGGGGGSPQSLPQTRTISVNKAAGTYYIIVIVVSNTWIGNCTGEASSYQTLTVGTCAGTTATYTATPSVTPSISPTFSSSQTPTPCAASPLLDLQVKERWGLSCADNQAAMTFRIYNRGASAYDLTNLRMSWWLRDNTAAQPYSASGGTATIYNSSDVATGASSGTTATINASFTPVCGSSPYANKRVDFTFPSSASIPVNGYAEFNTDMNRNWTAPFDDSCDDWSNLGNTSTSFQSLAGFTLHYGSCLVCEATDAANYDPATGDDPCGAAGTCAVLPTKTVTPSVSRTYTPTYTPTALSCTTPQCTDNWTIQGDGYAIPGGVHLTDNAGFQSSTMWSDYYLDLNQSFTLSYRMYFGASDAGADGIAFIMHNDPAGLGAIGDDGQALGYADQVGPNSGISPSLAIEFDTFQNIGTAGDLNWNEPAYDHTSIHLNGVGDEASAIGLTTAAASGGNIEDGVSHTVQVSWNPSSNQLLVYFDGSLRIAYNNNIRTNLGTSCVHWGFGASTGGSTNVHEVFDNACLTPTPTNTPAGTSTISPTWTRSQTYSVTPSISPTRSVTPSISPTWSVSPINSPTRTPTWSASPTRSVTFSHSPSISPTWTASPTRSPSISPTWSRTFTASPTPSITRTFTASPTNMPGSPTLTPTPAFELTKTANVSVATIGDTITYSISWRNDSGATRTMVIWDSVDAAITYAGCSVGGFSGGSCSLSGGVVTWTLPNATAGQSGTVTFWATVTSYPYWPFENSSKVVWFEPKRARELYLAILGVDIRRERLIQN